MRGYGEHSSAPSEMRSESQVRRSRPGEPQAVRIDYIAGYWPFEARIAFI